MDPLFRRAWTRSHSSTMIEIVLCCFYGIQRNSEASLYLIEIGVGNIDDFMKS